MADPCFRDYVQNVNIGDDLFGGLVGAAFVLMVMEGLGIAKFTLPGFLSFTLLIGSALYFLKPMRRNSQP